MVEPGARYEELKIPLPRPIHDLTEVSAVLGIPEWWPTGTRTAVALAHGSSGGMEDPLLVHLQEFLTDSKYLTLRFNFPFWEARRPGKRARPDRLSILEQTFVTALGVLNRDPTASPVHLFIGGKGLGARVAAQLATSRLRIDGAFFLGLPLHGLDRSDQIDADCLYRIVSPMLFIQGTRDRQCDIPTLQRTLTRIGAPTALHLSDGADQNFRALKKSERSTEEVHGETTHAVANWLKRRLLETV